MAQIEKTELIDHLDAYFNSNDAMPYEGFYCIDYEKKNMHTFKKFIIALVKKIDKLELQFIDAECFGYRSSWKTGDIYALCKDNKNINDTLKISLNETRGDRKVPTDYFLTISDNEIQIISESKKYIDHYKKVSRESLSDDFSSSIIKNRKPKQDEIESLNFEYQSGLELMFHLSQLESDKLTKELTLTSIEKAIDSINQTKGYITGYSSVWHATFGLATVFAEQLRIDHNWEWIWVEDGGSKTDVGWTIISPDGKYAINTDQVFYKKVMSKMHINITDFYAYVENHIKNSSVKEGNIQFLELPCD